MLSLILALFVRIVSNPVANVVQKILSQKYSALFINFISFVFLSLFCLYPAILNDWSFYDKSYWIYVVSAGILCTLGSVCLIKALQLGQMSVLGPINSYKCIVGLVTGYLLLGEVPSLVSLLGVLLIIFGSRFIFDTVEQGAGLKIFFRKEILLRFCALFFTGCEAVVLKKIIILSSAQESFILWCFSGLVFSTILLFFNKVKLEIMTFGDVFKCFIVALGLGAMQLSTNIVFEKLNVGLSLALFQLSSLVAVIFGYKIFKEGDLVKKITASIIMIIGSCLILLF